MLRTIVAFAGGRCKGEFAEQEDWEKRPPKSAEIRERIKQHVSGIFAFLDPPGDSRTLDQVEHGLVPSIFALGRLFLAYYLARREENSEAILRPWLAAGYTKRKKLERKYLNTFFGRVCFWRSYVRRKGSGGFHPLDLALAIPADGFTVWVSQMCARLSTLLSYEQVTAIMLYFLSWSPSKTSVEKAVLGLGRYTGAWFEAAVPPEDDGEVLVIQIDSKATPTATEEELAKRRRRRGEEPPALSPRHRGRAKRARRGPKKRRAPSDRSKNGRAATIVVMYTLKKAKDAKGNPVLLGPRNKWHYASYAPKRHAFEVARREADKRGFHVGSGKLVQIVTDGDEHFEELVKEYFPGARHTLDVVHVLERLWEVGRAVFPEGSSELAAWVKQQESLLYQGRERTVIENVSKLQRKTHGAVRRRIGEIHRYLAKRVPLMGYRELRRQDLEVASGAGEGAVRHVIAKRFDNGGMRWIRERAEPLLQLRCIEINGDWDAFVEFVQARLLCDSFRAGRPERLLTTRPGKIPAAEEAA